MGAETGQIRAFVAAPLDSEWLARIRRVQDALQRQTQTEGVRWSRPEQLHLTLKFFGNIPTHDLDALELALDRSAQGIASILLRVGRLGCFPSRQRPSVIWLGLAGELEELRRLQSNIERECERFGSHSETHGFHPHLTIGRVKAAGAQGRRIGEAVEAGQAENLGPWRVDEITLVQSLLGPQGSAYTPLARFKLHSPGVPR